VPLEERSISIPARDASGIRERCRITAVFVERRPFAPHEPIAPRRRTSRALPAGDLQQ